MRPRPATHRPITAPPSSAMTSAVGLPCVRAASVGAHVGERRGLHAEEAGEQGQERARRRTQSPRARRGLGLERRRTAAPTRPPRRPRAPCTRGRGTPSRLRGCSARCAAWSRCLRERFDTEVRPSATTRATAGGDGVDWEPFHCELLGLQDRRKEAAYIPHFPGMVKRPAGPEIACFSRAAPRGFLRSQSPDAVRHCAPGTGIRADLGAMPSGEDGPKLWSMAVNRSELRWNGWGRVRNSVALSEPQQRAVVETLAMNCGVPQTTRRAAAIPERLRPHAWSGASCSSWQRPSAPIRCAPA